MVLFFEHDIQNECCRVEKNAKGIVVKEQFRLADFVLTS